MSEKQLSASARRDEESRREAERRRKTTRTAVVIIVIVALLFAGSLLLKSDWLSRSVAAVTVGSDKVTPAEYKYYYQEAVTEYESTMYNTMGNDASYYLPDYSKSLAAQILDSETGETWADFYRERTYKLMRSTLSIAAEAKSAGFTLPEENREQMEADIESLKEQVNEYYGDTYKNFGAFLKARYGSSMNEDLYYRLNELRYTVTAYAEVVSDSLVYTDDELRDTYNENRDKFDVFTFRSFAVETDVPEQGDLSDEDYAPMRAAAVQDAKAAAELYAAYILEGVSPEEAGTPEDTEEPAEAPGITAEEHFIEAAKGYNEELYGTADSTLKKYVTGANLPSEASEWLIDAARVPGDITVIPDNDDESLVTKYSIYFLVERSSNDIGTVNIQQLYVAAAYVDEAEFENEEGELDTDAYDEAVAQAAADAQTKAEELYESWRQDGFTSESLKKLVKENSGDEIGGDSYENIPIRDNGLDAKLAGWMLDPARAAGDSTMIQTGDGTWMLLLFDGNGMMYNDALADAELRTADMLEWEESYNEVEVKIKWGYRLV